MIRMVGKGHFRWRRVFVAAIVRIVIVVVVSDPADGFGGRVIVIARVRCRPIAAAHQVLSNERDKHHQ